MHFFSAKHCYYIGSEAEFVAINSRGPNPLIH